MLFYICNKELALFKVLLDGVLLCLFGYLEINIMRGLQENLNTLFVIDGHGR